MSEIPSELLYNEEHEYLKQTEDEGVYVIGITDYAQGELGDVVFVELPAAGDTIERGEAFGTVEAVKAVSELYAPVGLEVLEINEALDQDPSLVNSDPYGEGWMIRARVTGEGDLDSLLDSGEYAEHIDE